MSRELTYRESGPGVRVDLNRLVASRGLVQANSGGGKSRAIRQMLEETHGRVQHLVIDPEGEFSTLREKFDYVIAAKAGGDTIAAPKYAARLCRHLVDAGASAILDLYDLTLDDRRGFVRYFLTELMALPRALWHPILVVIDEMHVFAPEAGQSQAAEAVTALATQGRKRGFCLVGATQRISKLHKDVAAELLNKMIGRTGLDIDVKRAGDELGMHKEERVVLKTLAPGEFFVYGPAISNEVVRVKTGDVVTSHPEAGKIGTAAPPPSAKVRAMLAQLADLPKEAEAEARTLEDLKKRNADLERQLRAAQRSPSSSATTTIEKPVVDQRAIDRAVAAARKPYDQRLIFIRRAIDRVAAPARQLADALGGLQGINFDPEPATNGNGNGHPPAINSAPAISSAPARTVTPRANARDSSTSLSGARLKIARGLAELEAIGVTQAKRAQLSFYAGLTFSGGYGSNTLGAMRTEGLLDYPTDGYLALTDAGRAAVGEIDPPDSLDELHARVRRHLSGLEERIFDAVVALGRDGSMTREELAEAVSATFSGGYGSNTLGKLRTAGILDYPEKGSVGPSDLLFPEGLE